MELVSPFLWSKKQNFWLYRLIVMVKANISIELFCGAVEPTFFDHARPQKDSLSCRKRAFLKKRKTEVGVTSQRKHFWATFTIKKSLPRIMLDLRKRAFLAFLAKTGLFEIFRPPFKFQKWPKIRGAQYWKRSWLKNYHRRTCTYNRADLERELPHTLDDLIPIDFFR